MRFGQNNSFWHNAEDGSVTGGTFSRSRLSRSRLSSRGSVLATGILVAATCLTVVTAPAVADTGHRADLIGAIQALTRAPDGPPGVIVTVQRDGRREVFAAGTAALGCDNSAPCTGLRLPRPTDSMRIASLAKTFSGAVALALVTDGALALNDTIGEVLPDLPKQWHRVKLRQLLNHTSGLPDYGRSEKFAEQVNADPTGNPPPRKLLSYVKNEPLVFEPGSRYEYSNSDNIVVGLMAQAVSGKGYRRVLRELVYKPASLRKTNLPRTVEMPRPLIHGYDFENNRPLDVSELVNFGGYAWASGGIVSTPGDLRRFVRAYVSGKLFGKAARKAQFRFRAGAQSSPPGPGDNAVGLALFRYRTRCGTVFGHTGSILGYTQFIAASRNGSKAVTFSISTQAAPALVPLLREAEEAAVCLALEG